MAVVKNILINIKAKSDKLASGLRASSSKLGKFARGMGKAFDKIGRKVNKLKRKLRTFRKRLNKTFSPNVMRSALKFGAILGGVLVAAAANAVRHFAKFEHSLSAVAAILGKTNPKLDEMKGKALTLGKTTMFTATQAAQGMELLARAGFNAQATIDTIEPVLNLAAAGSLELKEAADITAQIIRGMGLEIEDATRVTDVLAMAAAKANTDVSMLGQAFSHVAPVAGALSMSLEQTAALLATLSDAGLQADRAGTGLKAVLSEMAGEIEANGIGALDELINKGISVADAFARFGKRGAPAILALMEMKNTGKLVTEFMNAKGAAEEMAETKMDNLQGSLLILKSAWENLNITLGEKLAPTIRVIVEVASQFFTAISDAFTAVTEDGAASVVTAQQVALAFFDVVDVFVTIWNTVKRVGAGIAFIWNGLTAVVSSVLFAIAKNISFMVKYTAWGLDAIGAITTDTYNQISDAADGFTDSLKETAAESASAASQNWTDIFAEETDLDKWARKTKQNLLTSMRVAGEDSGEALAEGLVDGASKDPVEAMDFTEFEGMIEATEALQKWIDKQEEANELFGMSESQALIYKAGIEGVSEELIKEAAALENTMKVMEDHAALVERGKSLTESLRTPQQIYADSIKDINKLLGEGVITEDIWSKAFLDAEKTLAGADPTVELDAGAGGVTTGIDTAIGEFKFGQDIQDKIATDSLAQEKKMVELLTGIKDNISDGGGTGVMV